MAAPEIYERLSFESVLSYYMNVSYREPLLIIFLTGLLVLILALVLIRVLLKGIVKVIAQVVMMIILCTLVILAKPLHIYLAWNQIRLQEIGLIHERYFDNDMVFIFAYYVVPLLILTFFTSATNVYDAWIITSQQKAKIARAVPQTQPSALPNAAKKESANEEKSDATVAAKQKQPTPSQEKKEKKKAKKSDVAINNLATEEESKK